MEVSGIVPALRQGPLRDRDGLLLGRVEDQLFDAQTNRPVWLVVRLSGAEERRTLVPARAARPTVDGLCVAHDAEAVRGCPVTLAGAAPPRGHGAGAPPPPGRRPFGRAAAFPPGGP